MTQGTNKGTRLPKPRTRWLVGSSSRSRCGVLYACASA